MGTPLLLAQWSDTVTPEVVFLTLENYFAMFDRLAVAIGVFKIQTAIPAPPPSPSLHSTCLLACQDCRPCA